MKNEYFMHLSLAPKQTIVFTKKISLNWLYSCDLSRFYLVIFQSFARGKKKKMGSNFGHILLLLKMKWCTSWQHVIKWFFNWFFKIRRKIKLFLAFFSLSHYYVGTFWPNDSIVQCVKTSKLYNASQKHSFVTTKM